MNNMFVSFQVIQTSKTLLENSEGVYERILQTQKAGKRWSDGKAEQTAALNAWLWSHHLSEATQHRSLHMKFNT